MKTHLKERFVALRRSKHRLYCRRVFSVLAVLVMLATGLGTNWDPEEEEKEYQRRRDDPLKQQYIDRMRKNQPQPNEQQEPNADNELQEQVSDDTDFSVNENPESPE